jgi:hypothetical protein
MGMRALIYGIILLVVVPLTALFFLHKKSDACSRNPDYCAPKDGLMQPIPSLKVAGMPLTEIVRVPCRYLGTWSRKGDDGKFNITLNGDGTYAIVTTGTRRGLWGVQGNNMVWRHEDGYGRLSIVAINPILMPTAESFVLQEPDKSFVNFELIEAKQSTKCSKE